MGSRRLILGIVSLIGMVIRNSVILIGQSDTDNRRGSAPMDRGESLWRR